jgi:hypothetical protein
MISDSIVINKKSYLIGNSIGEGAVGEVCYASSDGRQYAMKIIRQYGRNPIIKQLVDQ